MTVKRMILILFLAVVLITAQYLYNHYYGPAIATAIEQEEAAKIAQLEADLIRAAESGRRNASSSSQRNIRRTTTGST